MSDICAKLNSALLKESYCDIELKLRNGTVRKCHSLVLRLHSSYFDTCVQSRWSKDAVLTSDCTRFDPVLLEYVILYMYGNDVVLTRDTVGQLLETCDFLCIQELKQKCADYLINNLNSENAFSSLALSERFSLVDVERTCLSFLDSYLNTSLNNSEDFYVLPRHLLLLIISHKSLVIHEEFLFEHLSQWVDQQSEDASELWDVLSPHICFCKMSIEFFISRCIPINVPADAVIRNKILLHCSSSQKVFDSAEIKSRSVVSENDMVFPRFYSSSSTPEWQCDELNGDRITFSVSESGLYLKAITFFGQADHTFLFSLALHDSVTGQTLYKCQERLDFITEHYCLLLRNSIPMIADKKYTAVVLVSGGTVHHGICGLKTIGLTVKNKHVTVSFEDPHVGKSTTHDGQFKDFIFCSMPLTRAPK